MHGAHKTLADNNVGLFGRMMLYLTHSSPKIQDVSLPADAFEVIIKKSGDSWLQGVSHSSYREFVYLQVQYSTEGVSGYVTVHLVAAGAVTMRSASCM